MDKNQRVDTLPGIILIGKKPLFTYVNSALYQLNNNQKVTIKARGRNTSKAIDVCEILRKKYVPNSKISALNIGSEELTSRENPKEKYNASTIEITVSL